jgi:hypothetical protein
LFPVKAPIRSEDGSGSISSNTSSF